MRYTKTPRTQSHLGLTVFAGVALLMACGAFAQTTATAVTGGINGAVQTADDRAVGRIPVAIRFRPTTPGVRLPVFNTDVTTGADGTFSVTSVPDGTYAVCPAPPAGTLLPPCNWEAEPTVTVANGKIAAMKPIVLKAGSDLWVHVDDPQGKRAAQEGRVPGASLLLMVRAPGVRPLHIPLTASGPGGFEHHLTVPVATSLVVSAFSTVFSITNAAGATSAGTGNKAQNVPTAINIPAGIGQHKEVITIH